ncbi:outer membrane lipoprotein chaperone LolA [Thiohalophilus sp.]|uniref:outer membrane lipoprotein chaperone LolA n=1 Tax=Thiohalophilus sp. TaxID=3028392 RepID=UPI002ACE96B4|nr:outer membrane lipoprotein chaperone LolA [Thiohalophilus sp.]MDZ7804514.1 outer membrane lipoprotein chaperone LolA [Thiohalophilus sp.]
MLKQIVITVMTGLLFSLPVQAAPTIEDYFGNLDSFEARFVQRLFSPEQELEEESHGIIKIKRPDRFYLKYTRPYEQLYVADGHRLWSYDADLEQIIVKQQENLLRDTPAMILSNPGNLQRQYRIEPYTDEGELNWFRLIPKSNENQFEEIQLGFDAEQIRIMELKDGFGRITRLEFDDIRRNPSFTAETFRFTPPPGVDVLEQ